MRNHTLPFAIMTAFVLNIGCGSSTGSPTAPAPSAQSPTATAEPNPAPQPQPQPQPTPAPTPAPPSPPPPAPEPSPEPRTTAVWDASTSSSHWYGTPLLPATFAVSWTAESVTFGPITAAPLAADARSILVRLTGPSPEIHIMFDEATGRGTWTYSGERGQAGGSLVRR